MLLTNSVRKLLLTERITFSVGWAGAVAGFLAFAIAGLTSENAQVVRSAYISMEIIGWYVIVPAGICALSACVNFIGQKFWVLNLMKPLT